MGSQITPTEWIWKDGEFIAWDDAQIHVLSHSVQFGSSVFEGIRCYETPDGPAIFRLDAHIRRLFDSCRIYRFPLDYTQQDVKAAACEVVRRNGVRECYIRPMVVRGYGTAGMIPIGAPVEVYIPCWPWGAYLGPEALEKGVDACVSTWNRVAPNTIPAGAKIAGNYLSGMLVKMEALSNGFEEGISLTSDGMVSEGSGQNLFLVRDGVLITPPIDGTMLPGITRDSILAIAADLDIPVRQEVVPREALYIADELFFTGTAAEVTPVRSVDRIPIADGRVGPITRALQQRYLAIAQGRWPDDHGWLAHADQPVEAAAP